MTDREAEARAVLREYGPLAGRESVWIDQALAAMLAFAAAERERCARVAESFAAAQRAKKTDPHGWDSLDSTLENEARVADDLAAAIRRLGAGGEEGGVSEPQKSKCWKCAEPMWFAPGRIEHARRSGSALYCAFGHPNHWNLGPSEQEKLSQQLSEERRLRQRAEQSVAYEADAARRAREDAEHQRRRANGYKGHAARITKRAKAGVCPCCNRTFSQLARHMAAQHPTFTPDVPSPPALMQERGDG